MEQTMPDGFVRKLEFRPAYDKRDPNPSKDYGIHGVDMTWYLKGPAGAVQFQLYTGWYLPHVRDEFERGYGLRCLTNPLPTDLGYHSPVPQYAGQEPLTRECAVLDGGLCYYDGSALNAVPVFDALCAGGEEALWEKLRAYYDAVFGPKGN